MITELAIFVCFLCPIVDLIIFKRSNKHQRLAIYAKSIFKLNLPLIADDLVDEISDAFHRGRVQLELQTDSGPWRQQRRGWVVKLSQCFFPLNTY